jgi:hypothetical protein
MKNDKMRIGIALLFLLGIVFSTLSIETYTVSPSTLKPGEEGSVSFTIKNVPSSTQSKENLQDVLVYFGPVEGIEYKTKSPYAVGTIEAGGSSLVSIAFKVLPNAKAGIITIPFFISQKDKTDMKTLNANIKIINPPIITIKSDKDFLLSTDKLTLFIENNGGKAEKVNLKINPSSGFGIIGKTDYYIGDLEKNVTITLPIDSRKVAEGVTTIPFIISYQQEGGMINQEEKPITITVKKEKTDISFSQLSSIITKKDNKLKMSVKNNGKKLEDFRITLIDQYVRSKDVTVINLGTLETQQTKEFEIPVFVEQEPGTKFVKFNLKWIEENVEKEQEILIPITINSDAEVGIYLEAKPTPLSSGTEHTLSVTVSNLGSYKISNVVVEIKENQAFEILNVQKEQYIGNLDSDSFSTVQYKIKVNPNAKGSYPIEFDVKYKDQSGLWITQKIENKIYISSKPNNNGNNEIYYLAGILIAAGVFYWFKIRKKKVKHIET